MVTSSKADWVAWNGPAITGAVGDAIANALSGAGEAIGDAAAAATDTPYPPASEPGEAPHKRSGRLTAALDAMNGTVSRDGDDVTLTVAVPKSPFYGRIVAKGHTKPPGATGPRPIITTELVDTAVGDLLDTVTDAVRRAVD